MRKLITIPLLCCLALGGCSASQRIMTEPATTASPLIELKQDYAVTRLNPNQLDARSFGEIAKHYQRTGSGPVYAVIAYNPDVKAGKTDMMQRDVKTALNQVGLHNSKTVALATNTDYPFVLVGYDALIASAPDQCKGHDMPGHQTATKMDDDYPLGCTVTGMMAKQIADPRDLRGRAGVGASADAERGANQVVTYRSGEVQDFLPSYFISELTAQ